MVTHVEKINIMEGPMWRKDIHKKRMKEKKRIPSSRGGHTGKKDTRREDIHKIGDRLTHKRDTHT